MKLNRDLKVRICLEWGSWCYYVQPEFSQLDIDWSGGISIEKGRISNPMLVKFDNWGFGPDTEKRFPVTTPEWDWDSIQSQQVRYNRMAGFVFTAEGKETSKVIINTKVKKISFLLGDIIQKKEMIFHIGQKYSCNDLKVRLDGYNPFRFQKEDIQEAAKREDAYKQLFLPEDFIKPSAFRTWFRMNTAWIGPGRKSEIKFSVGQMSLAKKDLKLRARFQATAAFQSKDESKSPHNIEEKSYTVSIPFKIKINGTLGYTETRTFFGQRHIPLLEEIEFEIERKFLKAENVLTIENHDKHSYLIITYLLLEEKLIEEKPAYKLDALPRHDDLIYVGFDTLLLPPPSIEKIINFVHQSQLGNLIYFRSDGYEVSMSQFKKWARMLKKYGIACLYFCYGRPDVVFCMRKIMGDLCLGQLFHECDGDMFGYKRINIERPFRYELNSSSHKTMKSAEEDYIAFLKSRWTVVSEADKDTPVLVSFSVVGHRYGYKTGAKVAISQLYKSHNLLLLSDARGSAREFGKKIWGCHIAEGSYKSPLGEEVLRLWWLCLYISYFSGASILYDEESLFRNFYEHPYGPNDYLPKKRQETMREFYKFTKFHNRRGTKRIDFAFMHGKYSCDCADGLDGIAFNDNLPKVWGTFGGSDEKWNYMEPEYGYQLVDIFYPRAWTHSLVQDPEDVRRWWSGTPYGEFDFISSEISLEKMKSYKFIIVPGWNTMTDDLYEKIRDYVKDGGEIFLSLPQLSTHIDRDFLKDMKDLSLIKGGNFIDLCGIKVENKTEKVREIVFSHNRGIRGLEKKVYKTDEYVYLKHPLVYSSKIKNVQARVIAYDKRTKNPVLIENSVGKGKIYLLTTYNYQGNTRLRRFIIDFLTSKIEGKLSPFKISGDIEDIYYSWYHEENEGIHRLYFINTDWTSKENIKDFHLKFDGRRITSKVKEGHLKSIIIKDSLVIEYEDLFLFVSKIQKVRAGYKISLVGEGAKSLSYRFLDEKAEPKEFYIQFGSNFKKDVLLINSLR